MQQRQLIAFSLGLSLLLLGAGAHGAVTSFTGTLTTVLGTGSGLPAAPIVASGSGVPISYSSSSFSLGSGVFVGNAFFPQATNVGGTVPLPTVAPSIYVIGNVVNASNGAGTLGAGGGPSGGFGGSLSSGNDLRSLLGVVATPVVFGSVAVPLNAGSPGTFTDIVAISGNIVTVTVIASGWTTGVVTFDDRNAGTLAPTGGTPLPNPFITSGTVTGTNNLGPNGGTITLVTPFVVRIQGTGQGLLAGYSTLQLTFIPEPSVLLLLGGGVAGLLTIGRLRERADR